MKLLSLLITVSLSQPFATTAQTKLVLDGPMHTSSRNNTLVLVGEHKTNLNHLVMTAQFIETVDVLKGADAIAKYGEAAKSGLIVIHPKDGAALLRINHIWDIYKVAPEDRKLKVCINKILMTEPELILIEQTEIEKVTVAPGRQWLNPEDATGERFIQIYTRTKNK